MHYLPTIKKNTFRLLVVTCLALACCERYDFVSDSSVNLRFSSDTISFDTVFVPLGSTTFSCKVYNPSDKNLIIDEVQLVKGSSSGFIMNVDGRAGYSLQNIRLAKKDSLYISIEVQKNKDLLLTDQIAFVLGGTTQTSRIELVAYGQDVFLFSKDTVLKNNYTFNATKPYIFTGNITIDTGVTATVDAGAKLFFGRKCGMIVNGSLAVSGLPSSPCIFSHPRYKDPWYSTATGQWEGIIVNAIGQANVSNAHMQGARYGFTVLDTLSLRTSYPQLRLSRAKIEYSEVGIINRNGSSWTDNTLITNSLTNAVQVEGGSCQFFQCTFATYDLSTSSYHGPQVVLQNFRLRSCSAGKCDTMLLPLEEASLGNNIIYGSNTYELSIKERTGTMMKYKFEYSIIKAGNQLDMSNPDRFYRISKVDPKFKNVEKNDFHLSEISQAINAGRQSTAFNFPKDLDGYDRTVEQDSSMGCYAYRP